MFGEWEEVDPRFILETALMHLSVQLSPLTDEHKSALRPATSMLLDGLADYRDSEFEDR